MQSCITILVQLMLLFTFIKSIDASKNEVNVNLLTFDRPNNASIIMSSDQDHLTIAGTKSHILTFDSKENSVNTFGNLNLTGGLNVETKVMSNAIQEWVLWHLDVFDKDDGLWYPSAFSACGNSADLFLGGHCNFGSIETSRLYEHLPIHKTVRITGRVHYIDQWTGESVYMKQGDTIVWARSWNWCPKILPTTCEKLGVNVCGRQYPDNLSNFFDVQFPHSESSLGLTFGSTIEKDADPCEVSWGIDDIAVYLM